MTREEAAKICQSIKYILENSDYTEAVEEALNMAIEALDQVCGNDCEHCEWVTCPKMEQEPTAEYYSDVISRQAAIDEMGYCQTFLFDTRDKDKKISLEDALYALEQLPSAQPFTSEQIQTMQELEAAQLEKAFELGKADRPTGHWIENAQEYYEMINEKGGGVDENTPYFTDDIACSECLAKFSVIDNETERFDFCPNCGAGMTGGEKE